MSSGYRSGQSSPDPCVPPPGGALAQPTLPSTLKLRAMLDAGVVDLSVVYRLYRSIMYCGGSARVLSWEGTPLRLRLRRKSSFMFSRNILRSKVPPSRSPPGPPSKRWASPAANARPRLSSGFPCAQPASRESTGRATQSAPQHMLGRRCRPGQETAGGGPGVLAGAGRSPEGAGPHFPAEGSARRPRASSQALTRGPRSGLRLLLSGPRSRAPTSYLRELSVNEGSINI